MYEIMIILCKIWVGETQRKDIGFSVVLKNGSKRVGCEVANKIQLGQCVFQ
jgi:hypothetical protein